VLRRSDVELGYDLGGLELIGAAVAVTLFRLGPNRAVIVLVVAAGDVAAVEARLRPQLGESLCVVPSRWTKAQLDTVGDYLHYHSSSRYSTGSSMSRRKTECRSQRFRWVSEAGTASEPSPAVRP
jgi:hypothetical protein